MRWLFGTSQVRDQTLSVSRLMCSLSRSVPEAYEPPDSTSTASGVHALEVGTTTLEGYSSPKTNSGFFSKALLVQTERGTETVQGDKPEVKVTIHGHTHLRDACSRIRGVWMCFSGGSSYAGYGLVGFDRRVRVFELSDYGETITTYKLLDGSGAGARADGTFARASASAAQATGTRTPDKTDNKPAEVVPVPVVNASQIHEQYEEQVSDLLDELKAEGDRVKDKNPDEAAALDELVNELQSEEDVAREEDASMGRRQSQRRQVSSRYAVLDYETLVGRGALQR